RRGAPAADENFTGKETRRGTSMAKLNINGRVRDVQVEPDMPLLWAIREHVGLTGTKYGCGIAQCGACSVHTNGEGQRACSTIVGSAAAGGGLALGFNLPFSASAAPAANSGAEVNAWVVIKPDDTCVIRIARTEMGQGTRTGLAQLVAEELGCDWKKVTTESVT